MKTEQELAWEWRTRRVWIVMAALFTIMPCASFVSSELGHWLGAPHTWGSRIVQWAGAAFFWLLFIIRPTRCNVVLAMAIAVSLGELVLVLNRLNIIRDRAAHTSNLGLIGIGALAAFCWIWHFREHSLEKP